MEILVSALLIALVLTGLSNIFLVGKKYVNLGRGKASAMELGKSFLDPLQMFVSQQERSLGAQNGWGQVNNCLTNPPNGCPGSQTVNNTLFTPNYNIGAIAGFPNLRRVQLTINWPKD
jgi:hypothetical protein